MIVKITFNGGAETYFYIPDKIKAEKILEHNKWKIQKYEIIALRQEVNSK